MRQLRFETFYPGWAELNWATSWTTVGKIRERCEERFGIEDKDWYFVDNWNLPFSQTKRMPFGIVFKHALDASFFRLTYDA